MIPRIAFEDCRPGTDVTMGTRGHFARMFDDSESYRRSSAVSDAPLPRSL